MKKKPQMDTDGHGLIRDIREIISQARSLTRRSVNSLQVISNYLIGMRIILEEQSGQERAAYGKATLKELSAELTKEFGRGYSRSNLEYIRKCYLTYAPSVEEKSQTLSGISDTQKIGKTLSDQSPLRKPHTLSEKVNILRQSRRIFTPKQHKLTLNAFVLAGISFTDDRLNVWI